MSIEKQAQREWRLMGRASVNVSNSLTANVNTYACSYPTVANVANRPQLSYLYRIPANTPAGYRLRFCLKHATAVDDKLAQCKLWGWDAGNGGGRLLAKLNLTAGSGVITAAPVREATDLTDGVTEWSHCDTISVETDNCELIEYGTGGTGDDANGIAELRFCPRGISWILTDFKCDALGTASSDGLVTIKNF